MDDVLVYVIVVVILPISTQESFVCITMRVNTVASTVCCMYVMLECFQCFMQMRSVWKQEKCKMFASCLNGETSYASVQHPHSYTFRSMEESKAFSCLRNSVQINLTFAIHLHREIGSDRVTGERTRKGEWSEKREEEGRTSDCKERAIRNQKLLLILL